MNIANPQYIVYNYVGIQARMVNTAQASLMIQGGTDSGVIIPLSGRPITMGRRSDNDVVVDETTVSRRHALILEGPDGFFLRDLSTTNGTYVNRNRVGHEELRLNHGDRIRLAGSEVVFVFRQEGPSTVRMSTETATIGMFRAAAASDVESVQSPDDSALAPAEARAEELRAEASARARELQAAAYTRAEEIEAEPRPEPEQSIEMKTDVGDGKPQLLGKDSDLFRLLQSKTGSVLTREEIATRLWPEMIEAGLADQVIEQSIQRLRAHVEDDPANPIHLTTAGEVGYLLI